MANNATPLLTQGVIATEAIAKNQAVNKNGGVAAYGAECIGFAQTSAAIGDRFSVTIAGSGIAIAAGTIAANSWVQVGAAGSVIAQLDGSIVGRAMNSAVAGDGVEVLVPISGNVTATINPVTGGLKLSAGASSFTWDAIYQSAVPIAAPLDTSNNVVLSVNIPGNSMGPNGRLQIRMLWSYLNNANTKSIKIRFGGTAYAYNAGLASLAGANVVVDILNRGMTNSQIMTPIGVNSTLTGLTQPFGVSNIDTTVDQLVTFECQKAVGTDSMVLEAAFVEICK
jgi:hypothetical protein